jgi:hypothetical protein
VDVDVSFISTSRSHVAADNCGGENSGKNDLGEKEVRNLGRVEGGLKGSRGSSLIDDLENEEYHLNHATNVEQQDLTVNKGRKVPFLTHISHLNSENINLNDTHPRTPTTPGTPVNLLRNSNFHSLLMHKPVTPQNATGV